AVLVAHHTRNEIFPNCHNESRDMTHPVGINGFGHAVTCLPEWVGPPGGIAELAASFETAAWQGFLLSFFSSFPISASRHFHLRWEFDHQPQCGVDSAITGLKATAITRLAVAGAPRRRSGHPPQCAPARSRAPLAGRDRA